MLLPLVFSSLHLIILPSAQWYVCDDEGYSESGTLNSITKQLPRLCLKRNLHVTFFGRARLSSQVSDQLHERDVLR